jgi:surfeit locus 1 family protein
MSLYLFPLLPLTTFGLGVWQTYRLQWKKNLLEEVAEKQALPPIDLNTE